VLATSGQSPDLPDLHHQIHSLEELLEKLELPGGRALLTIVFGEEVSGQLRKGNV
jgi:hypothetical protein